MRILLLTTFDRRNLTTGQGIILTHYARALPRVPGVIFTHARIATAMTVNATSGQDESAPTFELFAPPLSRLSTALGLVGLGRRDIALRLKEALRSGPPPDAVIWLGAPGDLLTRLLPRLTCVPTFYFAIDSYGLHASRNATSFVGRLKAWIAVWLERRILRSGYKGVIYVSAEDFAFAKKLCPAGKGPDAALIPIGIDLSEWSHRVAPLVRQSPRVMFSGVMNFLPNVRAAQYLVAHVLPLVSESCEVRIVGKTPTDEVRALARRDPRVVVTGTVPDMGNEYRSADIFVAPMVETAGIKIKLLQAMATGLPIIATRCCMEAFPRPPQSMIVAESAAEFALEITSLVKNAARRQLLGAANRRFVESDWSWESRAVALVDFVRRSRGSAGPKI